MDKKMYEGIIERLDEIEKKLDEILLRLPCYYTATIVYPPTDDTFTYTWKPNADELVYDTPHGTAIDYGNESDS